MLRPIIVILLISCLVVVQGVPNYGVGYPIGGRIIGGRDADISDYPYQLSLIVEDFGPSCGAVLIASNWALTAAHCTDGLVASNLTIQAASTLSNTTDGQFVQVSQIIQHDKFSYETADCDISLLQLSPEVIFSEKASPIKLATNSPEADLVATVTGWGVESEDDLPVAVSVLQVLEMPIVSHRICETAYAVRNDEITDNMLCAGFLGVGGKDTCTGDSGGPLVVGGVLSGIVSWGVGCAQAEFPGVYTDVSKFRSWIKDNTGI